MLKPLQETVTAIDSFHSTEENKLSFERGQIIYIRKKGDKGWYQGEIRVRESKNMFHLSICFILKGANQPIQVGWFPANCVQLQNASSPSTPTTTYQNTQGNC